MAESHRKSAALATVKVFLAHSHVETDLIESAKRLLEAKGASVYVDTEDTEMPGSTSSETASKLKDRIRRFDRFVLLASERSLASRWVPWELGFADASKGIEKVAILPFTDQSGTWKGTEYVGLYSTIQPADGGEVGVFEPGQSKGKLLSTWLNG